MSSLHARKKRWLLRITITNNGVQMAVKVCTVGEVGCITNYDNEKRSAEGCQGLHALTVGEVYYEFLKVEEFWDWVGSVIYIFGSWTCVRRRSRPCVPVSRLSTRSIRSCSASKPSSAPSVETLLVSGRKVSRWLPRPCKDRRRHPREHRCRLRHRAQRKSRQSRLRGTEHGLRRTSHAVGSWLVQLH
jgi:hypothetical protein